MKKDLKKIELENETSDVDERELKKEQRQEKLARRKKAKQKDTVARWSGLILLGLILILSFILWVAGEVENGSQSGGSPVREQAPFVESISSPTPSGVVQFQ